MIPKFQKDSYVPTQNDEQFYNPDIPYYMISATEWSDEGSPRHVRSPWHTSSGIRNLALSYFAQPQNYSNIEIFREDTLDERVYVKAMNGGFFEVTLRQFFFDRQYLCFMASDVRANPGSRFSWRKSSENSQIVE